MAEETQVLTVADVKELKELLAQAKLSGNVLKGDFLAKLANMSEDEIKGLDANGELSAFYEKLNANPRFKNFNKRQDLARGIEGGLEALRTLSNLSTARRQIDEAQRLENELIDPAAPPTTPKSQELADATEMARRDVTQPMKEIDPLLQRNMDMLRAGFNVADTASGGQAGVNAAMKQSAINQARTSNQQLIPQIEAIRRQKQEEYNRLISAGISEDDMRFKQSMQKYNVAENRYLMEAQAIGNLRAAGEENLFNQQNQMWDQAVGAVGGLVNQNYGGVQASEVSNELANPTMGYQIPQIQAPQIYNPNASLQSGVMSGVTNAAPKFTAIGGFGSKYQDYSQHLDQSLNSIYNPNQYQQRKF